MPLPLGPPVCALVTFRRLFDAPPRIVLPRFLPPSPASSTYWLLAEPLLQSSPTSVAPPSLPHPRRVVVTAPSLSEKSCAGSPPSAWPPPPVFLPSPHSPPFSWVWESKAAVRPSYTPLHICSPPPTTRISAGASSWTSPTPSTVSAESPCSQRSGNAPHIWTPATPVSPYSIWVRIPSIAAVVCSRGTLSAH